MKSLFIFLFFIVPFSLKAQGIEELSASDIQSGKDYFINTDAIDKGLVIIFHTINCPYTELYQNRIKLAIDSYSQRGFSFIFVNPSPVETKDLPSLKAHIEKSTILHPYLLDQDQSWKNFFGVKKIPEILILTTNEGRVKVSYRGAIDNNPQVEKSVSEKYFEKAVNQILQGQNPSPSQVRAVGCNIRSF